MSLCGQPTLGEIHRPISVLIERASRAVIAELGCAISGEKHCMGLQPPVSDASVMKEANSAGDLSDEINGAKRISAARGGALLPDVIGKRRDEARLHDEQ